MAKKSRFTGFSASKIVEEMTQKNSNSGENSYQGDTWKPSLEKDQETAEYIIRFLPSIDEDTDVHFVTRPTHMVKFSSSGNYIYEPCPMRNGKTKECPICEVVNPLFKGSDSEKKIAYAQYAKARFYSNIYVVKDERNDGENEGKILMYEYGKTIHDLCVKSMSVDDDDEDAEAVVYFDPLDGADLKIIMKKVAGFTNYDESKFIRKGKALKLKGGDELDEDNIDEFMEGAFDLKEKLLSDEKFKSYDELKSIYENQGYDKKKKESDDSDDDDDDDLAEDAIEESFSKKKTKKEVQARNPDSKKPIKEEKEVDDEDYSMSDSDDDDDDDLAALLSDDD